MARLEITVRCLDCKDAGNEAEQFMKLDPAHPGWPGVFADIGLFGCKHNNDKGPCIVAEEFKKKQKNSNKKKRK